MFHRPTTPAKSPPPPNDPQLGPIPENGTKPAQQPRRSSLNFLRRSRSGEPLGRSSSGNKLSKKALREEERLRLKREADSVPKLPPTLPTIYNGAPPPELQSFGGENARTSAIGMRNYSRGSADLYSPSLSPPPMPGSPSSPFDPYARTESMANRGRYSYASSAVSTINSPRRVRRRKDPTPFNILVIGTRNSGKTSFLNFLRASLAPTSKRNQIAAQGHAVPTSVTNSGFASHYLETEIDGERIGLTLWDSTGLERGLVDLQLRETSAFIESKFEDTFTEEMKVVRAPGVQDTHIHCTFLLLDPVRLDSNLSAAALARSTNGAGTHGKPTRLIPGSLDEDLDLQVLRLLRGRTTVIPIISKADTLTSAHMSHLKRTVQESLKSAGLDPLEGLSLDENYETASSGEGSSSDSDSDLPRQKTATLPEPVSSPKSTVSPSEAIKTPTHKKRLSTGSLHRRPPPAQEDSATTALPLSTLSPDQYDPTIVGRRFAWGVADPYDAKHCDFTRLKEMVFSDWRGELREASREMWYEGWRTSRLNGHRRKTGR
ncbi:MAG: hypothetical protein M1814_006690 [Vezdaea aestivalis]|nr:MAG: hypothetical protein M1814_006690 [Vezdaea aestivalis]